MKFLKNVLKYFLLILVTFLFINCNYIIISEVEGKSQDDNWNQLMGNNNRTCFSKSSVPKEKVEPWRFYTSGFNRAPICVNDYIYAGGDKLYCIDINTGFEVWNYNVAINSVPTYYKNKIYFNAYEHTYCLNSKTGGLIWKTNTSGTYTSSVIVDENKVYSTTTYQPGGTYVLDADNGSLIKHYNLSVGMHFSALKYKNLLYISKNIGTWRDTKLIAYDLNSDEIKWVGDEIESPPCLDNNIIFYICDNYNGTYNATLIAIDIITGKTLWMNKIYEYPDAWNAIKPGPAAAFNRIYAVCPNKIVYCFDQMNGELIWQRKLDTKYHCTPAISSNGCVIIFGDTLYCLDSKTGKTLWQYDMESNHPIMSPIIYKGNIIGYDGAELIVFGNNPYLIYYVIVVVITIVAIMVIFFFHNKRKKKRKAEQKNLKLEQEKPLIS